MHEKGMGYILNYLIDNQMKIKRKDGFYGF